MFWFEIEVLYVNLTLKLNHDGLAHCFASVVLGALEHCSAVGEAQLHSLMPAVVAGLKSAHAELHAAAATILARVFPRVSIGSDNYLPGDGGISCLRPIISEFR